MIKTKKEENKEQCKKAKFKSIIIEVLIILFLLVLVHLNV